MKGILFRFLIDHIFKARLTNSSLTAGIYYSNVLRYFDTCQNGLKSYFVLRTGLTNIVRGIWGHKTIITFCQLISISIDCRTHV